MKRAMQTLAVAACAGTLALVWYGCGRKTPPQGVETKLGQPAPPAAAPVRAPADTPVPSTSWTSTTLSMEFVPVEPGSFEMGASSGGADDEKPVHAVKITKQFWIGKYEVTQKQYEVLTRDNPSAHKGPQYPVERVSWQMAVAFCEDLTKREHDAGGLSPSYVYRLPTEAEWEYAARGGSKGKGYTFSGSEEADDVAWHKGNSGGNSHEVGEKPANELGVHDMSGNVFEWCHDWNDSEYYSRSPEADPQGPESARLRVYRGGAWHYQKMYSRSADRSGGEPTSLNPYAGFRLVLANPLE